MFHETRIILTSSKKVEEYLTGNENARAILLDCAIVRGESLSSSHEALDFVSSTANNKDNLSN